MCVAYLVVKRDIFKTHAQFFCGENKFFLGICFFVLYFVLGRRTDDKRWVAKRIY